MGNNKKTVKCSYCNRLGHNRVTCPKIIIRVDELRQKFGNSHPTVHEHDNYKESYSEKSSRNAKRDRRCSYCRLPSHNKRTCTSYREDLSKLKKTNNRWRQNILKEFTSRGIGVGALMAHSNHLSTIENPNSAWVITSIEWDRIVWTNDNKKIVSLVLVKNPAISRSLTLEQLLNNDESYYHRWDVVSPSDDLQMPPGWDTVQDENFSKIAVEVMDSIQKEDYDTLFVKLMQKKVRIKYLFGDGDDEEAHSIR